MNGYCSDLDDVESSLSDVDYDEQPYVQQQPRAKAQSNALVCQHSLSDEDHDEQSDVQEQPRAKAQSDALVCQQLNRYMSSQNQNHSRKSQSLSLFTQIASREQQKQMILYYAQKEMENQELYNTLAIKEKTEHYHLMNNLLNNKPLDNLQQHSNFNSGFNSSTFINNSSMSNFNFDNSPNQLYHQFLQKRMYQTCLEKYQTVTTENFNHVLTIDKSQFVNGEKNVLHNAYQMLIIIWEYFEDNQHTCDNQYDTQPRIIHETGLFLSGGVKPENVLYRGCNIELNHTIQPDVSLVENLRRFLFYFPENYAFFVFEQGNNDKVEEMDEIDRSFYHEHKQDAKNAKCANLSKKLKLLKKHLGSIPMLLDTVDYGVEVYQPSHHGQNNFDKKERTSILTMFQGKRRLSLPFIRLLYMWIIEMQKFRSNINIGDHTTITLGNKTLPVIKENLLGTRKGTRMGYYDVISNILDVLDLELDLHNNNDSLEYIGVSRIVIPKTAPKRKADDISHGEESS